MALHKKLLAELWGTFALVFAAVGSAAAGGDLLDQALANGLVLSVLVAAYAGISGAHFNPAVTLAFALVKRCDWRDVPLYIVTQLVAATAASYAVIELYFPVYGAVIYRGAALPESLATPPIVLFAGEGLITLLLMLGIYGTMIDRRGADGGGTSTKFGGMGVGFAVAANILTLGPVTGASMNPARSFGPMVFLFRDYPAALQLHWCYWAGPIVGAVTGALMYELMLLRAANHEPAE